MDVNSAVERVSGIPRAAIIGRLASEIVRGIDEWWLKTCAEFVETGGPAQFEREVPQLSRWFDVHLYHQEGDMFVMLFDDITPRKKMEIKLKESEEMFRKFSEASPAAVIVYRENIPLYVNTAASLISEYSREELLAMNFAGLFRSDSRQRVLGTSENRMSGYDARANYEVKLITKSGREKWMEVSSGLISYRGMPAGIVVSMEVTERKKAEEILQRDKEALEKLVTARTRELLKANAELERSRRMADIGRLSATVAHEMRNPLAAIKVAAYNIRKKANNPLLHSHIENINKKVLEGDTIIQNLLSFTRIKVVDLRILHIGKVIRECIGTVSQKYTHRNVKLEVHLDCGQDDVIEADDTQFRIVVCNILDNAYQALADMAGTVIVTVCKNEKQEWKISITDTGTGIGEDEMGKIFEPFHTTKSRGTGLGLAVCKEIVDMHKGTIQFQSAKGKGTTFTVTLPVRQQAGQKIGDGVR